MSNDATNVQLVLDGKINLGAYGSPAPDSAAFVPGEEYAEIGYYSEDGYELTPAPGDSEDYKGHNGDIVISSQDPGNWNVAFSGLETKKEILEAYMDATVDDSDGSVTVTKASTDTYRSLITLGISAEDKLVLTHYPRVKVSDREAITYNRTTLKAYGLTFTTYKDPTLGYHFKQWDQLLIAGDGISIVRSATPSAAAATELVSISGLGFAGATNVKFGATAATDFTVISDALIVASVPAGSAGSAAITVTTPAGTSPAFAYTRGA